MSLARCSVPFDRNPQLKPGLAALVTWLIDASYSSHAIGRIQRYVAVHGTLAGSIVEPEDEAGAEEAFTGAIEPVPLDSDAWDREDVFMDAGLLWRGEHPLPFGPEPDGDPDAPDANPHLRFPGNLSLALRRAVPPISGGAPLDGDRADFEAWLEQVDRPYPPDDDRAAEVRAWYNRHPLSEFNAIRDDATERPS
jgi:hypothetical protein